MLGKKDRQSDFFENYISNLVPKNHILLRIKSKVDFSVIEQQLGNLYSGRMGRPSYPPLVLFKMLLLEYFYNLSDVKISQECQYNLLFRKFIGLQVSQKVPDDTTLVVFRKRLGEKVFNELFDLVVRQAKEKGLTTEELGIVDASAIKANICNFNGANILRQARRHLVTAVEKYTKEEFPDKKQYLIKEKSFRKPEPEELKEEKEKTEELIKRIKGKYGKTVEAKIALVEEILQTPEEEIPEIKSMADPDARFGQTSLTKKFTGFKTLVSYDDGSELITSCRMLPGNRREGEKGELKALIEQDKQKGINHTAIVGDGGFDSKNNRQYCHDAGMQAFIPSRRPNRHLNKFNYNKKKNKLICPAGETAASDCSHADGRMYIFSAKQCRGCLQQGSCPGTKNMERTRVYVSNDYLAKLEDEGEKKTLALKRRKLIEKKFGEAKMWHGLEKARYRGMPKVAIQTFLTFIVINLKRMVKLIERSNQLAVVEGVMG